MSPTREKKSQPIDSMAKLQRRLPVILKALNDDPALLVAASANPLLAIEEIGYRITGDFREELELRLRFSEETRRRLGKLKKDLSSAAGRDLPLHDPDKLHRVLFSEMGIAEPDADACRQALKHAALEPSDHRLTSAPRPAVFGHDAADPLAVLEGAHPVIGPLLEYRALEASEPRFAPESLYRKIRRGEVELPVSRLRLRMGHDRNANGEG